MYKQTVDEVKVMKTPEASFLTWQRKFYTEDDCIAHLKILKWQDGFRCPRCMHDKGFELISREVTECSKSHKQTSVLQVLFFIVAIYPC
jgi:hypothetical protein